MQTIQLDRAGLIDGLGRSKFSRHLLELIRHIDVSQGAVIGLEGAWGSGKTSVLKSLSLYAEEIPPDSRPSLFEFKPWMLSGTSSLVDAMLIQFAAEVGLNRADGKQHDLAIKILDYVKALRLTKYAAPLAEMLKPGAGIALAGAAYAAGEAAEATKGLRWWLNKRKPRQSPPLTERKGAVIDALALWPHRIVVILDDIDRLPPGEVVAMIQAVKAVADFPNVVYVLAYDPTVVAHAIQSAVEVKDGLAYLEKIVQLPVRLPEVPQSKLNLHARERLGQIVRTGELGAQEAADLEKSWAVVFALFRTPRDIERLRTKLQVALPVLKGAVNIADVLLLEALDIAFPAVVLWIGRNAGLLMKAGIAQYNNDLTGKGLFADNLAFELSNEKRQKNREIAAESWRAEVNGRIQQHAVGRVLRFLFDNIKGEWDWETAVERSQFHRVQAYRFWYQWRCYHDHNEPWTVPELEGFIREPSKIIATGLHRDKMRLPN